MKLAFSNAACPELDFDALIEKSHAWGYDGFELTALHGQADLGLIASLTERAAAVREELKAANQQIAAVNAGEFVAHDSTAREGGKRRVISAIKAATAVGCPLVTVRAAAPPRGAIHQRILDKFVAALTPAAREAESAGVILAIENSGALSRTHDLWFIRDAVCSPAMQVCIDPRRSAAVGDSLSTVLNRLGASLALVRFSAKDLPEQPREDERFTPDVGSRDPQFLIEVLKGFAYKGWVCISDSIQDSEDAHDGLFARAAKVLRAEIDNPPVVLTAYKGDKNAPRFSGATASA